MARSRRGSLMSTGSTLTHSSTHHVPATELVNLPATTPFIVVAYGRDTSQNNFFLAPGSASVDMRHKSPRLHNTFTSAVPYLHTRTNSAGVLGRLSHLRMLTPRTSADLPVASLSDVNGRVANGPILTPKTSADLPAAPTVVRAPPRVNTLLPSRPRNEENIRPSRRSVDVHVNLPPLYPTPNSNPSNVPSIEPNSLSNYSDSITQVSESKALRNVPVPSPNLPVPQQPATAPNFKFPHEVQPRVSLDNNVAPVPQFNRLPDRHSSLPTNIKPNVGHPSLSARSSNLDGFTAGSSHSSHGQPRLNHKDSILSAGSSYASCMVPWSETPITVHSSGGLVRVALPPYTEVVGFASGEVCFPRDTVEVLELNGLSDVHLPDNNVYTGVQGIIYPRLYPRAGAVLCRSVKSDVHPKPRTHLVSAGLGLLGSSLQSENTQRPNRFILRSSEHYIEEIQPDHPVLCDPHKLPPLPPELVCSPAGHNGCHVVVESRFVPIAVLLFCSVVLSIPGFVQGLGSGDRSWGDIINQVIGTGSVLLIAVLGVFERLFGTQLISRRSFEGSFNVTSNVAAKLFAPEKVKTIEKFACDPRLCPKLIKDYKNSAVRTSRDGWLKVGDGIPSDEMRYHGYVVLDDHGAVLDLLDAYIYSCAHKKEQNRVRINRPERKRGIQLCTHFTGDEVFA